ncbi:MAG: T9SS type A sorting domain-containing protein [Ignavibacteria bacterium]|nr:T9SS type A sorting domain-containing protein [Ignavibacteria bacterium]
MRKNTLRKISLSLIALLAILMTFNTSYSQSTANYTFSSSTTASLTDMSSGTTLVWIAGTDTYTASALTLPFDFYFMGVRYGQFSINPDGAVRLGSTAISGNGTSVAASTVLLCPQSNDNRVGSSVASGKVHYKTTGSAPNRVLIVEWLNMKLPWNGADSTSSAKHSTWQLRVYESTGKVEFVYGSMYNMATAATTMNAFIASSNTSNTVGWLGTLNGTVTYNTTATPTTTSFTAQANMTGLHSASDGSRTMFTFTPPTAPSAPTGLSFTSVTATSMTLNWSDISGEYGYAIYNSTDGGSTYNYVTSTAANATSQAVSSLVPSTSYMWRIYAFNEGNLSTALSGTQATTAPGEIVSTGSGGNWSATGTWVGGVVPTSSDNVTIADGATVTIDAAASCYNLTVGQGASGILQYEVTTARTLTVGNNVTVAANGVFKVQTSGTVQTGHICNVTGNVTNNGQIDFNNSTWQQRVDLRFSGSSNSTFSGSATTANTDLGLLSVNKGSGNVTTSSPYVDITLTNGFNARNSATGPWLNTTTCTGIIKISGSFTKTGDSIFTAAAYSLPSTGGLWLNNSNYSHTGLNGSPTLSGLLRVTAGTFKFGTATGNTPTLAATTIFYIDGGTLNFASRLNSASALTYTQTSGTVNINQNGNTSSATPSFGLSSTTASITMSGGTIQLHLISGGTTPQDWNLQTAPSGTIGTTVIFGSTSTVTRGASGFIFSARGYLPNVLIDSTTNNKTLRDTVGAMNIQGTLTVPTGCTFDNGGTGTTATVASMNGNVVNRGNITISNVSASNRIQFGGTSAQTYNAGGFTGSFGTNASPVLGVNISNASGVTLNDSIITFRVNLFSGTVTNSGKIRIGNYSATAVAVQRGGGSSAVGAFDAAPNFQYPSTTGLDILYSTTSTVTTSFEIPSGRQMRGFSANSGGLTVSGGDIILNQGTRQTLTMAAGNVDFGANNLSMGTTTTIDTIVYTTGFLNFTTGSMTRFFPTSGLPTAVGTLSGAGTNKGFYPIANSSNNRHFAVAFSVQNALSTAGSITVSHSSASGTTGVTSYSDAGVNVDTRSNASWTVTQSGCVLTGTITTRFQASGSLFAVNSLTNLRQVNSTFAAYATAQNGSNTVSDPQVNRSGMSLTDLVSTFYFGGNSADIGSLITWTGSSGNWSTPGNWSSGVVPTSTDNVSLAPASSATITLDGNYSVNALTVGTNTILTTGSNNLTVNGAFSHTAGTITLGSGTLDCKGDFTRSGGTFTSGTSTLTFSGTAATQNIDFSASGTTVYNIIFGGGDAGGFTKNLTAARTLTVSNDYTVYTTAKLALTAASATAHNISGNLVWGGVAGGTNIGSLTLTLSGTGKTIDGSATDNPQIIKGKKDAHGLFTERVVDLSTTTDEKERMKIQAIQGGADGVDYVTHSVAQEQGEIKNESGKISEEKSSSNEKSKIDGLDKSDVLTKSDAPVSTNKVIHQIELLNTYDRLKSNVDEIIAGKQPNEILSIILDDRTIVIRPEGYFDTPISSADVNITIAGTGSYTLSDNIGIPTGRTLTVTGRLNAGSSVISGAGSFALGTATTSILGIASASPNANGGTVTTTTQTWGSAGTIDYNAAGDQTITTGGGTTSSGHNPSCLMTLSNSGIKSMFGDLYLTSSGSATVQVLTVNSGVTLSTNGNMIRFNNAGPSDGTGRLLYINSGGSVANSSGMLKFQANAWGGGIFAPTGTSLGAIRLSFTTSTNNMGINPVGTNPNITIGSLTTDSTAGGTLRGSVTAASNITVSGDVNIQPTTLTNTGGGFNAVSSADTIKIQGNYTTLSTAATQDLMTNGITGNVLEFNGSSAQTVTFPTTLTAVTIFTGTKMRVNNSAGVTFTNNDASACTFTLGTGGTYEGSAGTLSLGAADVFAYPANATCTFSGGDISSANWPTSNGPTNVVFNTSNATLPGDRTVSGTLTITNVFVNTGGNTLTLGTSGANLGTLSYTGGGIRGSFKRWFAASTVNNVIFPMDNGSGALCQATLSFTAAPSAGTLTVTFNNSGSGQLPESGGSGNGYYIPAPELGVNFINLAPQYWAINAGDGLAGGTYNLALRGDGIPNISNRQYVSILKRTNNVSPWTWAFANHQIADSSSGPIYSFNYIGGTSFSEFGIGGNVDNLLPVELSSFTASVNVRNVKMDWVTTSEENNRGFDVERKALGTTSWSKIGFVEGKGNSTKSNNYSFSDLNLQSGKYNYRLKQVDYNGNYKYYNLLSLVEIGVPTKYDMSQNYPNPFNPTTKINYDLPFDSKVSIRLFDITGREVATILNQTVPAGYQTVQFNAASLASGTYFYNIIAEGGNGNKFISTKKMVLVK